MRTDVLLGILLYVAVLAVYLPWLPWALGHGVVRKSPLVFFCYIGLLTQNAIGSVFVIFPSLADRREFFSFTYGGLLIVQALIFYLVTTPQVVRRVPEPLPYHLSPGIERLQLALLAAASASIVALYVSQLGTPPVVMALTGQLSGVDLIKYRVQQTYGLEDYSLFHLGITVLPTLIAALAVAMSLTFRTKLVLLLVPIAAGVAALPGGKGSIIDVVSAAGVAYVLCRLGFVAGARGRIAIGKLVFWSMVSFAPIFVMYRLYYADLSLARTLLAIVYRIVGVNSESIAGAVAYVEQGGQLAGASLPTVRGLLDHEYVNLSQEMHFFMFGPGGGAPMSALAEGYVNFGTVGFVLFGFVSFLLVVAYERAIAILPRNGLTFCILVLYAVFATKIAQASIVATFVSLTYAAFFLVLLASRVPLQVFGSGRTDAAELPSG